MRLSSRLMATQADGRRHRPARAHARRRARAEALGAVAAHRRRCASTRTCWSTASSCSTSARYTRLGGDRRRRHRAGLAGDRGAAARCSTIADPWDFEEVYGALHDFARGYPFDPEREDYLVHITTGTHVAQICLFLLTESRHFPARLLQTSPPRRGARPARAATASSTSTSRVRPPRPALPQGAAARGSSFLKAGIETRNAAFNRLIERIEQVAIALARPDPAIGPTGAGKSQLARRIYELKQAAAPGRGRVRRGQLRDPARRRRDVRAVRPRRRARSPARSRERAGLLRKADGGVLFLDEIGELGADEQAMLLRAIEEKRFYPLGSRPRGRAATSS